MDKVYTTYTKRWRIFIIAVIYGARFSISVSESHLNIFQNGQTPLHVASMLDKTETVNLLLGHKAAINAVDKI